jgi:Sulfotransferase domain
VKRVIVVASHRRSGTHLTLDSLRANAPDVNARFMNLDRIEPGHRKHIPIGEFDRRLRSRDGVVLVKTHSLPDVRAWLTPEAGEYAMALLAEAPVVYVHRDGRDVLVSLYHYMASYSPDVARRPFKEFIRNQLAAPDAPALTRPAYWQHHGFAWLRAEPRALAPFGTMLTDFEGTLRTIAQQLDLRVRATVAPVPLDTDRGLARAIRRLLHGPALGAGRRSTAIRPRGGTTGGWREAFDDDDTAFFDAEAGAALRTFGYV